MLLGPTLPLSHPAGKKLWTPSMTSTPFRMVLWARCCGFTGFWQDPESPSRLGVEFGSPSFPHLKLAWCKFWGLFVFRGDFRHPWLRRYLDRARLISTSSARIYPWRVRRHLWKCRCCRPHHLIILQCILEASDQVIFWPLGQSAAQVAKLLGVTPL